MQPRNSRLSKTTKELTRSNRHSTLAEAILRDAPETEKTEKTRSVARTNSKHFVHFGPLGMLALFTCSAILDYEEARFRRVRILQLLVPYV